VSDIVDKIQKAAVRRLNQMAQQVIDDTGRQIIDSIEDFKALSQQSNEILMRFMTNLNNNFDKLMGRTQVINPSHCGMFFVIKKLNVSQCYLDDCHLSIGMWVEFAGKTTTTLAVSWLQKSARSTNSFS